MITRDILNKNINALFLNKLKIFKILIVNINFATDLFFAFRKMHIAYVDVVQLNTTFKQSSYRLWRPANQEDFLMWCGLTDNVDGFFYGKKRMPKP